MNYESMSNEELIAEYNRQKRIESINKILDKALKVRINSAYGAIGNSNFRFYMKEIAEGITLTGQILLKRVDRNINQFMNEYLGSNKIDYIIAQDTDSNYLLLNDVVKKHVPEKTLVEDVVEFVDRWHKKYIAPKIKNITDDMQDNMYVYEHRLKFVRDVISDNAIFLVKKRYAMQVWDVEGVRYKTPEMKIMGVESVKSSTPEYCKKAINEAISIMLNSENNKDLIDYMSKVKQEFMNLSVEEIASPRGITDLDKWVDQIHEQDLFSLEKTVKTWYKKNTPIHVKASINFNINLDKKNLNNKYTKIVNGDKIKFVYLTTPNPTKINSIAFDEELPKEFGLHQYIDYNTQHEKALYNPVKAIADVIGWKIEDDGALF